MHASRIIRCALPDNISHIATRGRLLLPSLCIIEYLDDILIVFPPQHLLYHPPAPFPDSAIPKVAVLITVFGKPQILCALLAAAFGHAELFGHAGTA